MDYLKIGMIQMAKKEKTVAQKLLNNEPVNQLNLFIQFIILIALIFATVSSIFVKEFSVVVMALISFMLILLGYNNYVIFKRKYFTVLYVLAGFAFLIMAVLEVYGS